MRPLTLAELADSMVEALDGEGAEPRIDWFSAADLIRRGED